MKNVSASWYNFGLLLGIGLNELETWDTKHRDAAMCWNKASNCALNQELIVIKVLLILVYSGDG